MYISYPAFGRASAAGVWLLGSGWPSIGGLLWVEGDLNEGPTMLTYVGVVLIILVFEWRDG